MSGDRDEDGSAPTLDAATLPAATLADAPAPTDPPGYQTGALLGSGGMGEVMVAHDARVGRRVALKRMRSRAPSPDALARFLREARIQARLEHPAIVPVYDLGRDADGAPFFTMKRLAGVTLHDKLGAPAAPLAPLLRAFVDVCLAIEFAHARGVVHRDLKPTNIMLGDFGEVYVLDWGVARVLGTPAADETPPAADEGLGDDIATLDSRTQAGAVLGTPGYMPPEQLAGVEVTPAADVYALGSILFEILAGEPLHPRGAAAMGSTIQTPTGSPAERRPDRAIPLELELACVSALAEDPAARPTARALADRVQRYLDGDRDEERRRALSQEALAEAEAAVASGDAGRRADAVAAAGRALALDPTSKAAAALVSSLMLAPPETMPPELAAALAEIDHGHVVNAARAGAFAIAAFFLFAPFLAVLRVVSWGAVGAMFGAAAALSGWMGIMAARRSVHVMVFVFAYHVFMVILGRVFGVWVLIPGLIALSSTALIGLPQLTERLGLTIGLALVALLAPAGLEALGLLPPTWSFADGALVARSGMFELDGGAAGLLLILAHVAMIIVNVTLARSLARSSRAAHVRAELQAWHLRKLVPEATPRRA